MTTEEMQEQETPEQAEEETTTESAPVAEETVEEEAAPEEQAEPDPPKGVQKRINELTRAKYEALREKERLEQELENERKKHEAPQPASTAKPTLEDFDHDEGQYYEALTEWKVNEALKARETREAEQKRQASDKQRQDAIVEHATQTIGHGRTNFEDFDEAIAPIVPLLNTYDMAESLMDMEKPEAVVYYLGKNPEEADAIARMTPTKRAVALGKIEVKLGQVPGKKVSNAPPPVKPVGGKSAAQVDISKMSGDEYREWRKKQRET
jgi:hypothetical protein